MKALSIVDNWRIRKVIELECRLNRKKDMNKVYLLWENCGPDVEVYGVFKTREHAKRYIMHYHNEDIDDDSWFGEHLDILSLSKEAS